MDAPTPRDLVAAIEASVPAAVQDVLDRGVDVNALCEIKTQPYGYSHFGSARKLLAAGPGEPTYVHCLFFALRNLAAKAYSGDVASNDQKVQRTIDAHAIIDILLAANADTRARSTFYVADEVGGLGIQRRNSDRISFWHLVEDDTPENFLMYLCSNVLSAVVPELASVLARMIASRAEISFETTDKMKVLKDMLFSDRFSDVGFDCKDSTETLHAHRAVLAHASPYFANMFSGSWLESKQRTIETDHSEQVMRALMQFVYTGESYSPQQRCLSYPPCAMCASNAWSSSWRPSGFAST